MMGPSNIHRYRQNVLSVGATTLNLSSSGTYGSETAWIDSGGGYSLYEPEPSYQQSVQQTGMRSTPDVAFDGDPNTGVEVYSTDPNTGLGSWQASVERAWAHRPGPAYRDRRPGPRTRRAAEPGRSNADPALTLRGLIHLL